MATPQDGRVDSPTDRTVAARRSAALVAAVTAFVVPPCDHVRWGVHRGQHRRQGLFTYPTIVLEMTVDKIPANLDPAVARFIVLSTEGVQNGGGVLIGLALLMVALVAARSDLWGHWAPRWPPR